MLRTPTSGCQDGAEGRIFAKTKAHRTQEQAEQEGDLEHDIGHDMVDRLAKHRAHGMIPEGDLRASLAARAAALRYHIYVATELAHWDGEDKAMWQYVKQRAANNA